MSSGANVGPVRRLRIPAPFCSWQFWLMIAGVAPVAYLNILLVWLYMLSYLATPSGAIAYMAATVHSAALVWAAIGFIRFAKEAKARRKAGLPGRFPSLSTFACVVAVLLFQAPIIPIAAHFAAPDVSDRVWVKVITAWRHKELGF